MLVRDSLFTVLFFCLYILLLPAPGWAGEQRLLPLNAQSALLMDVENGQVLYAQNHKQPRPVASTTKVMTALIALAGAELHGTVRVSPRAAAVEESSMHLRQGENLTLENLLYGALLSSGNDACVAIAEHVAGSEKTFVAFMNEKALLIGAENTCFQNTNGLPVRGHHSTALDLALITRYALHNPVFCRIVKTRYKLVKEPGSFEHHLVNTNKLLWRYPWADGVKTGTTSEAGKCLIASASREGRRLLAVVLNDGDRFGDAVRLLEFGFSSFRQVHVVYAGEVCARVSVLGGVCKTVPAVAAGAVKVNIPANRMDLLGKKVNLLSSVSAPVREGQLLGRVTIFVDGIQVGQADIVAAGSVDRMLPLQKIMKRVIHFDG